MTSKGTLFLWIALLLIQSSSQSQNYRRYRGRARHNNGLKSYGSYYSGASYSLSKPVFSPYTTHSSERSTSEPFAQNLKLFPGGTAKRTVYTGRYCAYPTTRRVPHRVKNGTQTFLKRVVSQCAWSSLYCNPQVRYVVASRSSYRIQMKEIRRDEWRCCPGFSGPNCEQACFNCTTTAELSDKIDQLSRQISLATRTENDRSPTNDSFSFGDLRGPEGPPGPMGLKGQRGPPGSVGAKGDIGAIGPRGFPGIAGPSGIKGNPGAEGSPGLNGSPGRNGQKGEPGIAGPEGIAGHRGEKGNTGSPGQKGDLGPVGPVGLSGQPGVQGPIGPQGPKGSPGRRGITGLQGPPGSPGVCQCDSGPAISADLPVTEDLEAGPMKSRPLKAVYQGPATIDFCGGTLWKKHVTQISCDFDFALSFPSADMFARDDRHYDETYETRRKGGTLCLFSQTKGPRKWAVETGLNISKSEFKRSNPTEPHNDFEYDEAYDDEQAHFVKRQLELPPLPSYIYTNDHYVIYRPSTSKTHNDSLSRLYSPFFSNSQQGICLTFRYLVRSRSKTKSGLLLFLVPCNPPYRIPVLNITASSANSPLHWRKAVVPLPDYKRPYQVVFEARPEKGGLDFIAVDDVIFSACGSTSCVHEGITRRNEELWKSSNCRECTCLEGTVECFRIDCAPTSCQYTYTPVGYCCPVCCPDQGFNSNEYASGDGSTETLSYSDDESSNTTTVFPGYYSYEDEEVETTRTVHPTVRLDEKGCPLSSVTTRASAQPKSNEDAVCMLPKDAGPCRARIPKIYFDSSAMRCRPFTYGGCEGNANNFDSPQACRRMCVPQADAPRRVLSDDVRPRRPRRCNLAKARGSCRAYMPRFYYDRKEGRCRLFIFSGCSGNGNKFLTPHACRDVCGGSTPVMGNEQARPRPRKKRKPANCYLPKVRGPCRAAHSRFYYNHATKKCQIFLYGGCGGNDNNFELPNQCQQTCGGVPSFEYERIVEERRPRVNARAPRVSKDAGCTQPMDSGPCKGSFYRYFFNSRTTKCSVFLYGGCRGNGNNFETPEQCQKMCGSDGFNFTLTLKSDMIDTPLPQTKSRSRGKRGRPGPPGPRGPPGIGVQGPPGPQGPPGQMPSAFPDAAEINSIKATIESLKSRIVFLETNFLNNQIPAEDDEGTENVPPFASPEDLINTDQSSEQPESKDASKESPARRGDASDEELTYYYN